VKTCMLAGLAVFACAAVAHADTYVWDWQTSDGGYVANGTGTGGGAMESIHAEFDSVTNRFTWNVVFGSSDTQGYTLAVNSGPNPKGHAGELALLYFDATQPTNARVTAFAYNGQNSFTSWQDGNGVAPGNQAPDIIHTINDTSWIINKSVDTLSGGRRAFNLTVDATIMNTHVPIYPGTGGVSEWTGIGFGPQNIGLWMHTFKGLDTGGYGPDGQLCGWNFGGQGWFDGSNIQLVPLPTPALMGMAGLGVAGFIVRRRKQQQA
jgi:hypothetical protein